ncbi:MAG: helix-turn-helix transcriptional regulator [Oscillospiraceae bacterium]
MDCDKNDRILETFYRIIRGEKISIRKTASYYNVSTKTINRDINQIKAFLSNHGELMDYAQLKYSRSDKSYYLDKNEFLQNKELFAIVKVILGSRCFNEFELSSIISKLKSFTTPNDKEMLENIINKEVLKYHGVKSNCVSVIDNLWKVINCIEDRKVITIQYLKMNTNIVKRKIKPVSIMFSEYYFYLIAYKYNDLNFSPVYFRIDRILSITEHKEVFYLEYKYDFNEGDLREKNQFMFPGDNIKIRFEFNGLSTQAILDRLPTAKVIEVKGSNSNHCIIEAVVNYGRGIIMYLLSQGAWVKVLSPQCLIDDISMEVEKMKNLYKSNDDNNI